MLDPGGRVAEPLRPQRVCHGIPPEPIDSAIIAQSQTVPEGFATIFDRHAGAVHRYLARRASRSVADDLVSETFLVAFGQRGRYDVTKPDALPWLYGIATNLLR